MSKSNSRRNFLKTAGKFAIYSPPALILMSKPGHEVFAKSCNQGVGDPVVRDYCDPGYSGYVLNNDDFTTAGTGYPGAKLKYPLD